MRLSLQLSTASLVFFAIAAAPRAEEATRDPAVHFAHQSAYGTSGPNLPRFTPARPEVIAARTTARIPTSQAPTVVATPAADPYGFAAHLNSYRASAGLPPLRYDPELTNWAALNNSHQNSRGLGHHVNPNCRQNSCWNTTSAAHTMNTWAHSPGHRENMLAPNVRSFGIAYGPGPYWTLNLR